MNRSIGIDIGSSTVKLAVLESDVLTRVEVIPASANPLAAAEKLLADTGQFPVAVTGYGRDLLEVKYNTPSLTEIKAHALGARFLFPGCTAVIDIGGQDLKVISLDAKGRVARFEMNDRCAAGTGRFLEVMASRLGFALDSFGDAALTGADTVEISAMCTVFAESEVVGLLNRGGNADDIAHAVHRSVARRISGMFKRLSPDTEWVALTGGGSKNRALVHLLEELLGLKARVSEQGQAAGAIGSAIYAQNNENGKSLSPSNTPSTGC